MKTCPKCSNNISEYWTDRTFLLQNGATKVIKATRYRVQCLWCGLLGPEGPNEVSALYKWNQLPRNEEVDLPF